MKASLKDLISKRLLKTYNSNKILQYMGKKRKYKVKLPSYDLLFMDAYFICLELLTSEFRKAKPAYSVLTRLNILFTLVKSC